MTRWDNETDEALAAMAQAGSEAAFHELVERHTPSVYRIARGITRSSSEAEDIVQETFLKAYKGLEGFSAHKASFRTWLLAIARNQSINVFGVLKRKAARFLASEDNEETDRRSLEYADAASWRNPEDLLSMKQEHGRLSRALEGLPERQRTALLLKTQEDMSYEEIAGIMNSSASAVESLIFRARRALLEVMEKW